jgi:uncharacterized membrane protein
MQLIRWLHLLGVVVWVGGMFFAHFALRPAAQELLEPPLRLPLMAATMGRFFRWAALSVAVILATGIAWILAAGGFGMVGVYTHVMFVLGIVMALVFGYIWFALYPRLTVAIAAKNFPEAGAHLARIRQLVTVNLVLGLVTITVAVLGK